MRVPLPISLRLTLWYGLTLLLLLSGFAVFCYTGFHLALHRDFDRHLTHEERELLPFVTADEKGPRFEGLDALTSVAYRSEGVYGTYVRLLTPGGGVRYQSPNFSAYPPLPVAVPAGTERTSASVTWAGLPARTRYVPLRAHPRAPLVGWLELTGFEWSLHQELHRLRLTLVLGVALSMAFALVAGWWLARRTLRPVSTMTVAAGRMGSGNLSARLPADFGPRDELTELAETFNGLLDRLERSVERERRFTANAAHELLTPLATLRSEAEVALRRERDAPAYREVIRQALIDVARMTSIVQDLLRLARAEALSPQPGDRLELYELVAERAARLQALAAERGVSLDVEAGPALAVMAQAGPLAEVVDNLIANALKYTPAGGHVVVRLETQQGRAGFSVEDTGAGFSPGEADRLFDRFYRSDDAAVQAQAGSGLGLAIVQAVVEAFGGRVEASSSGPGRGSRFAVWLPRAPRKGTSSS